MATIQRPSFMDEERQQDVFKPQGNNPAATPQGALAAPAPQLGSGPSTQVGGGQGLNASGNKALGGQTAGAYTQSQSKFPRIMALLGKNQSQAGAPNLAAGVQEQAKQGTSQLQAEANTYGARGTTFQTPDAQSAARNAAQGLDTEKVRADLAADTSRRADFKYEGPTSFDGIGAFTSKEGAAKALAAANVGGGNYTQGMGTLDSILLGRDAGFHRQADQAQVAKGGFDDSLRATTQGFNSAGGRLDQESQRGQAYQAELRGALQGQADTISRGAAQSQQWENEKNAAIRESRAAAERQVLESFKAQRSAEFDRSNPFLQANNKVVEQALKDPSLAGLFDAGEDGSGMGSADAERFNRLQGLLGGSLAQAGVQGRAASFNESDYRQRGRAALDALISKLLVAPNQAASSGAVGPGTVGRPEDTARNAPKSTQGVVDKAVKDVKEAVNPKTAPKKAVQVAKSIPKAVEKVAPKPVVKVVKKLDPRNW